MPSSMQPSDHPFLTHVRRVSDRLRADDRPASSVDEWQEQRGQIRRNLVEAWGGFPDEKCPLDPVIHRTLQRDGYRVECLTLQTMPGVRMTANAYVPDQPGKRPAVLCVHGHWRLAKSEPVVQARCIGLAKLGFFVLMVDAFGAGERGLGKALGEYHGEMVAATLLPVGKPLSGIQVYENMRAADYLQSRPEVNPDRLGITGCSGGGNQTMYAGAFEERFKCVVPVCSVGTYRAYLGAACCMCEVVPGALQFTEEWGILSLVAPRGLMVINASRDAFQFSIGEAAKSMAKARSIFDLYRQSQNITHATFDWKHDYHQPMREAMYGWMTLHLKGEGDGSPIPEPEIKTEPAEVLRCFPADSRPEQFVSLPQFAAAQGRALQKEQQPPDHRNQWMAERQLILSGLLKSLNRSARSSGKTAAWDGNRFRCNPTRDISLDAHADPEGSKGVCVVLDLEAGVQASDGETAARLRKDGWRIVTLDLTATAGNAVKPDSIGRAPDHNSAEWSFWIGQPLIGQWLSDISYALDAVLKRYPAERVAVVGRGTAAVPALLTGVTDSRITDTVFVDGLASFVSPEPYQQQRLATVIPHVVARSGDIPQLASLVAPRKLTIAGGQTGAGAVLTHGKLTAAFEFTAAVYRLSGQSTRLKITDADAWEL